MKTLVLVSVLFVTVAAFTKGGRTFGEDSEFVPDYFSRNSWKEESHPVEDFGPSFSAPTTHETRKSPFFFDLLHDHLNKVHQQVRPYAFGHPTFKTSVNTPQQPGKGTQIKPFGCQGCHPWNDIFTKFFGKTFKKHLVPTINSSFVNSLPPNYKNSTSHTHIEDDSKVVVNQTIHKKTGDNFHHFYHVKVVHVFPNGETEVEEKDFEAPEKPDIDTTFGLDKAEDEVSLDKLFPKDSPLTSSKRKLLKRSVDAGLGTNNKKISFPPSHINQFPHSMANRKDLVVADGKDKTSRSWVYKDMAGNSYVYSVNHNDKGDLKKKKPSYTERDAEVSGPIRPADLSRDTAVNPDGREGQQGFYMVEPSAEIFNLTLVIAEADSRANNN